MDSPIHVKLDREEAVSARRILLESEMDILRLMQRISNYREVRLSELRKKEKLRINVKKAYSELSKILREFPKVGTKRDIIKKEKVIIEEAIKRKDLQDKLLEIREQLERLS